MNCPIYIGTSGWHYAHWRGSFYPNDLPMRKWLSFYAQRFETVEINSSLYRLPTAETLQSWADGTLPGFCFAAKASRYPTDMKKLKDPQPALATFLARVALLGGKLAPFSYNSRPTGAVISTGWRRSLPSSQANAASPLNA